MAPAPTNLRLFGATPEERAAARGADSLRLTWGLAASATSYQIQVDGVIRPFTIGERLQGLSPNTSHRIMVRAVLADGSTSDWSDLVVFVTRPPAPPAPDQALGGLDLWEVEIRWRVAMSFPGADQTEVELYRALDGEEDTLIHRGPLQGTFVDRGDPAMRSKRYGLVIVAVHADMAENRSFPGPWLGASRPPKARSLGTVPTRTASSYRPMTGGIFDPTNPWRL